MATDTPLPWSPDWLRARAQIDEQRKRTERRLRRLKWLIGLPLVMAALALCCALRLA